jgi:proteasome lid subunit RPN8/RPN11
VIARLSLTAGAWDDLLAHASEASPAECCGLLIGHPGQVTASARASNVAPDPTRRFEVDPADHFAAIRQARAAGLRVVGAYHSHPNGPPHPSETDQAEALEDENFVHVIIDPRHRTIAAYLLISGNFVALPLVRSA